MNETEYLEQRVDDQIKWLSGKSRSNKNRYKALRTVVILLSVLIPFLVAIDMYPSMKYIIGGIGVAISFIEGLLLLNKHHDKWMNYRAASETLKREKFLFVTRTGKYKEGDSFTNFVTSIESLLAKENSNWMEYIKEDDKQGGGE